MSATGYLLILLFFLDLPLCQTNENNVLAKLDTQKLSKVVSVTACPKTCFCELSGTKATVKNCSKDPINGLHKLVYLHPNLTHLSIVDSHLSGLPCVLSNLSQLTDLDLQRNAIENFNLECLRNLAFLRNVELSSNRISILRNGSFYDFPSLEEVHLDNNSISIIELDVFLQLNRLKNLNDLTLSRNCLKTLDSWPIPLGNQQLIIFRLSVDDNSIETFTNLAPAPSRSCENGGGILLWSVEDNYISHFMDFFNGWNYNISTLEQLQVCLDNLQLDLIGNPLNCDCVDYEIYKYFHNTADFFYTALRCHQPQNLRGQSPTAIALDKFVCDKYDTCPEGCTCINTPYYKKMGITCRKYNGTSLPKIVPSLSTAEYSYDIDVHNTNLSTVDYLPYLEQTDRAKLSNNSIRAITMGALLALQNVTLLYLDSNQLKTLPQNITNMRLQKGVKLKLGGNPWVCDCDILHTKDWMMVHVTAIIDRSNINCYSPTRMAGYNMIAVDRMLFCPDNNITKYVIIAAVAGCIALIFLICFLLCFISKKKVWIYKKTRWHPLDNYKRLEEDKEFDIFLSYANEDEEYVDDYLIPELQNRGFKVCYHRVNFCGGKPITTNIFECISKSKRVLVFFSAAFQNSDFCMWEFCVTLELDLKERTHRLVVIKDTDVDIETLGVTQRSYFKTSTYIPREAKDFWDNLLYSLPIEGMGARLVPADAEE